MSMDMKKRSFKKLITLSLTLAMLTGVAGCGKQQSLNAETNPYMERAITVSYTHLDVYKRQAHSIQGLQCHKGCAGESMGRA